MLDDVVWSVKESHSTCHYYMVLLSVWRHASRPPLVLALLCWTCRLLPRCAYVCVGLLVHAILIVCDERKEVVTDQTLLSRYSCSKIRIGQSNYDRRLPYMYWLLHVKIGAYLCT